MEFLVLILKHFDVNTPHKEEKISFCFDNLPKESRIEPFCVFQEVEHQRTNQHTRFWRSCICEVVMEICSGGLPFWTTFYGLALYLRVYLHPTLQAGLLELDKFRSPAVEIAQRK